MIFSNSLFSSPFFIVKKLCTFFIVILGKNFLNPFFSLSSKKNGLPREWDYVKEHDEYVLVHSLTFDIAGRQTVLSNNYILLMPVITLTLLVFNLVMRSKNMAQ